MIFCNLKMLLSARNLKISRVANDTGISRTTLTSLSQNDLKGVQLTTLDTLCQYLEIDPKQFFEYHPFNFEYDLDICWDNNNSKTLGIDRFDTTLLFNVYSKGVKKDVIKYTGDLEITYQDNSDLGGADVQYHIDFDLSDKKYYERYINKLSTYARTLILIQHIRPLLDETIRNKYNKKKPLSLGGMMNITL